MKRVKIPRDRIRTKTIKGIKYLVYRDYSTKVEKSFYGHTVKELEDKYNKWLQDNDDIKRPTNISKLQDFYKNWLEVKRCSWKLTTYNSYYNFYKNWVNGSKLGKLKLTDVTQDDIIRFINSINLSYSTKETRLLHIKSFFKWCVEREYISKNVSVGIKIKSFEVIEEKDHYINSEILEKILEGVKGTNKEVIFNLCARCGLRLGEAMAISSKDLISPNRLRINKAMIKVTEGGKSKQFITTPKNKYSVRTIIIPPDIYEMVANKRSRILDRSSYQNYIKKNYGYSMHDLRHTFTTNAVQKGVSIDVLREYLGHSPSSRILEEVYNHIQEEFKEKEISKIF